jgi:transposase
MNSNSFPAQENLPVMRENLPLIEHSSDTNIRGKKWVSPFANKKMKKLFHMEAMATIYKEGELADYYYRKVEEGKSKMVVLNAVHNKISH